MALGITLILAALIGLFYGIAKKNKLCALSSAAVLILIAVLWIIYLYLYSLNPY